MAGLDEHKRRVVKHRTRTAQPKQGRGGFSVGAKNVPTGAYIGHAKKHKAELIHKAKVKKAYHKLLDKEGAPPAEPAVPTDEPPAALGRFAPEDPSDDLLERVSKKDQRPKAAPTASTKKQPYFRAPPPAPKAPKEVRPQRTRDQAMDERAHRRALWDKKSPSRRGRERGQPDLSARMDVMLEKIQRTT